MVNSTSAGTNSTSAGTNSTSVATNSSSAKTNSTIHTDFLTSIQHNPTSQNSTTYY